MNTQNYLKLFLFPILLGCQAASQPLAAEHPDIEGFAEQLRDAVLEYDTGKLIDLGLPEAELANEDAEELYQCYLYGIGPCHRWMSENWYPVEDILKEEDTDFQLVCLEQLCWLTYFRSSIAQDELEKPSSYMVYYVTTRVRLVGENWELIGPLFNAGAGNPAMDDY